MHWPLVPSLEPLLPDKIKEAGAEPDAVAKMNAGEGMVASSDANSDPEAFGDDGQIGIVYRSL